MDSSVCCNDVEQTSVLGPYNEERCPGDPIIEQLKMLQLPGEVCKGCKESGTDSASTKTHKSWHVRMARMFELLFKQDIEIKAHTFERAYDRLEHKLQRLKHIRSIIDHHTQRLHASVNALADTMTAQFLCDLEEISKENQRRNVEVLQQIKNGIYRYTWVK